MRLTYTEKRMLVKYRMGKYKLLTVLMIPVYAFGLNKKIEKKYSTRRVEKVFQRSAFYSNVLGSIIILMFFLAIVWGVFTFLKAFVGTYVNLILDIIFPGLPFLMFFLNLVLVLFDCKLSIIERQRGKYFVELNLSSNNVEHRKIVNRKLAFRCLKDILLLIGVGVVFYLLGIGREIC